jgi:hypothetical protein
MPINDPEPFENSTLFRQNNWIKFIKSDEWAEYKTLLLTRKEYLEKQVLIYVSTKKFDEAMRFQAKAEELTAIITKAESHLTEIGEKADG